MKMFRVIAKNTIFNKIKKIRIPLQFLYKEVGV